MRVWSSSTWLSSCVSFSSFSSRIALSSAIWLLRMDGCYDHVSLSEYHRATVTLTCDMLSASACCVVLVGGSSCRAETSGETETFPCCFSYQTEPYEPTLFKMACNRRGSAPWKVTVPWLSAGRFHRQVAEAPDLMKVPGHCRAETSRSPREIAYRRPSP